MSERFRRDGKVKSRNFEVEIYQSTLGSLQSRIFTVSSVDGVHIYKALLTLGLDVVPKAEISDAASRILSSH